MQCTYYQHFCRVQQLVKNYPVGI